MGSASNTWNDFYLDSYRAICTAVCGRECGCTATQNVETLLLQMLEEAVDNGYLDSPSRVSVLFVDCINCLTVAVERRRLDWINRVRRSLMCFFIADFNIIS